ncbi:MAG: hypothetical protein K8R60_15075 [Burkholderiales bacterium]|nr:hypothetical protein [Burkholderiales bacterium]
MLKKTLLATAVLFAATGAFAQTTTAVKEAGKATGEKVMQGTENVKAAAASEPSKTVHKAKAADHKAKAAAHGSAASAAAKNIGK